MSTPPQAPQTLGYRPDIDGLRAVAVLLVVFNHAGIRRVSGGFIGVDIFFVISGYLISSLILKEIAAGNFSIARFYERRFRRIAPALLVTLAVTSVFAYKYLFPFEIKSFAQSELGALFSVSNIVFWQQTDYFDAIRKWKPLLHTWSLGVEEQFYFIFPVFLLALSRWGRRHLKLILALLTCLGFALAWYWTPRDTPAAFFLTPLRVWEFLVGTLLSIDALPTLDRPWKRDLAATVGMLLILASAVHYSDSVPFPSWRALPPCIGAVLILAAGQTGTSAVGRLLSWNPIRWIGLISYSLYLWHWPIQTFQSTNSILLSDAHPAWVIRIVVIAVSLLVATISWRFIEQPFRSGIFRSARLPLYAINGGLFLCVLAFSGYILKHNGWMPASVPRFAAYYDFGKVNPGVDSVRWGTCYLEPSDFPALFNASVCLAIDPSRPQYLLLGDSHAASVYWGLKTTFPELNISQLTTTGCAPTLKRPPGYKDCNKVTAFTYSDYLVHHHVDTVLLVGRWTSGDADQIAQTTAWIKQHGMKVVVFGPSIEFDRPLVRLVEVAHHDHDPAAFTRHRDAAPEQLDRTFAALARDQWHVPYISMYEDLCHLPSTPGAETASGCAVYGAPGIALLWDTDHLSPAGSILYAQAIRARKQLP